MDDDIACLSKSQRLYVVVLGVAGIRVPISTARCSGHGSFSGPFVQVEELARSSRPVVPDYRGTVEPPDFNRQADREWLKQTWSLAEPQMR